MMPKNNPLPFSNSKTLQEKPSLKKSPSAVISKYYKNFGGF
jgi:hypothetical protein